MFFSFVGVTGAQVKKELAKGKSDSEILAWIEKHGKHDRCAGQRHLWSTLMEQRAPTSVETAQLFQRNLQESGAPKREDITTWFDLLDVDDHVTFGGQP